LFSALGNDKVALPKEPCDRPNDGAGRKQKMIERMKWMIIDLLVRLNVLAVVPVKANRGYDARRTYRR
jgi:hypothetical protein